MSELFTNARRFLKIRTSSLKNDVLVCLNPSQDLQPAPFSAILYCFATIDLLGALLRGKADSEPSENSKQYMKEMMRYPEREVKFLQKIFRHKTVHLAQPNQNFEDDGEKFLWKLDHNNRENHLRTENNMFSLSIFSFCEDIIDSVYYPNGYLHRLGQEKNLQDNFDTAFKEIYGI